eukprot:9730847-Lingulodinium_polyedra.AAC.1
MRADHVREGVHYKALCAGAGPDGRLGVQVWVARTSMSRCWLPRQFLRECYGRRLRCLAGGC